MAGGASAATYQWDPSQTGATTGASGGAGLWNAADLSWFNGATTTDVAWSSITGDTAVFGGSGGVVSLGGEIAVNALRFDKGGYTINNGGTAANTLILSGTGAAITVTNAADTATISAVIAVSGAWSKAGLGTLTLSGTNTFTGGLTLNAGTLNINNATALGATASTFTIAGGTIDNTSGAAITLTNNNPQTWSGDFAFTGTNALNLGTGAVSLSATRNVAVNASTLTVGGIISGTGFGITKTGAGTLALAGANTFTGGLTINGGTVAATAGNNLGAGPITLDGGTLALNQTAQIQLSAAQAITVGAGGGTIDNTVAAKLLMNTAGGLTGSGTLTRTASANSSSLSNTFQISAANTGFTGAVILNGGVTEVSANGLGTGATAGNSITVNSGAELVANNSTMANALVLNGGVIGGDGGNSTFSGPITVNGSTSVRLGDVYQDTNRNLTITGNLTGAGALTTINNGTTATNATGQILTLNPTTGNNSGFTGALNVSTGNNVVFSTANALTGGAVVVNSSASQMAGVGYGYDFGSTVPTFTNTRTGTTDGGIFGINTTLAATTTLDMSTLGGGGMFLGSQTSGTYTADTLGADAGVYRLGGGTGTLTLPNATLIGTNNLVVGDSRVNGNGTVVLGSANTFIGSVSVANGTLSVGTINSVSGGSASSNLGAPTTVATGTINLGSNAATGGLRYTGAGETTDRVINLAGTTGGAAIEQSGTGLLKFTSDVTATGADSKTFTLLGSSSGTGEIAGAIVDNSTTNKTSLAKSGTGTWTLSGVNTYTGSTTVNSGTLILNGETGSLASSGLALGSLAKFTYLGKSTGSTQALGALTSTAFQNTVTSTYGGAGTTELVFTTLGRTAGSSLNLVTSGGTAGTNNIIRATDQNAGFVNAGIYYNGNNFAYNSAKGSTSVVRAPIYGTDSNFVNVATGATLGNTTNVQVQGNITAQTTASVATLRFDAARTLTITSGNTLTVANGGIIAAGGTSTIATGTVTAGTAEMNIRTDATTDALTISSVLAGSGGLTKSGAGTLTLSNTANTFTGNIFVNGGTLAYAGSGTADQGALGAAGARTITLTNGAILSPTSTSNPSANTKSFVVGAGGATFNVASGVTLQLDDAGQFSGTGDLTVTGAGTGTVYLNNQVFNFSGNVFVNSGTLKLGTNSGVLGSSAGRTITIGSGGVVDAQIANLPFGLVLTGTGISSGGALVNNGTTAASFTGPVTINSGATIGGSGSGGITLSGNVSGSSLTKVGTNLLTLSGLNTYGSTTITAGGVQFNSPAAIGASGASVSAAAGTIVAAGYAIDQAFLGRISTPANAFTVGLGANSANDLDFNTAGLTSAILGATGAFTYTGTLTPSGSTYRLGGGGGTLTLGNTNAVTGAKDLIVSGNTILASSNDYSGTTTVNAGTLTLTGASNSSAITINSNTTLQFGNGGTTGSLGTAALVNNGTLAYNHSDDFTTDVFTGNGTIAQSGTNRLTINPATTSISALAFNAAGTVDIGATNRSIGISGGSAIQMNAAGTATIDATGGGAITIGFANMDVGAASGGTLVVNPVIQGSNALDISNGGAGTVVFNGANTYSGVTNIQSGTLSVASLNSVATNATLGTVHANSSNLGAPTTAANGTINLGSNAATTTAALKYTGAGETTDRVLNLAGTTNGATIDQSGTGLLKFTSNLTASGGGSKTLTLQGSTAGTGEIAGAIVDNSTSNKTSVTKAGTGTWTLSGTSTYTGTTTVNGGTLALTGTLGSTAITVNAGGTFTQSSTGVIGGTASLTNKGNTTLSGTNTFTGNVTVNAGPLTITNSSALGTGTKTITVSPTTNPTSNPSLRLDGSSGDITLPATMSFTTSFDALNGGPMPDAGAIVNVAGNNTIQGNFTLQSGGGGTTFLSNAGTLTIAGNLTPNTGTRSVFLRGDGNGVISGNIVNGSTAAMPVTKEFGNGTWTLSGTNTYTGATTVNSGTLALTGTLGSTAIIVGTVGTFTQSSTGVIGGTASLTTHGNTTLSGANTYTGATTVNDGTLALTGTLGSTAITVSPAGTFTQSSTGVIGGTAASLTTSGNTTLAGKNTYTGATNVKAGKLAIALSGSISGSTQVKIDSGATLDVSAFSGTGGFAVGAAQTFIGNGMVQGDLNVGGALAGSGNVGGSVTALSGSTILPGNGAGTLTIAGNFSLNAAAHLALELGTTAAIGSDRLSIGSGNVTLGGSLDITLLPTFADNIGDTFTIILNGGGSAINGLFSNVTPTGATTGLLTLADGHQFVVNYAANADGGAVANDVALTIAAVPEPSTIVAMLGGAGMLLGLRRRKGSR